MMRFVNNCKPGSDKRTGNLSLEELQEAKLETIVLVQREYFPEEYECLQKGKVKPKLTLIRQLNLYLERDVIKCRGRLEHAQLSEEAKFPVLLPKGCPITKLIVREHHEAQAHMGVDATVASAWIIQGIVWTKEKDQNPKKAYIIVFTYPVTRGIHVELVKNQSCNSLLMAFRNFCSRRGFPSLMLSDNATTFVAASEYLKAMAENISVQEHLNQVECKWKFIPARAPWFGAIWERLIGLLKSCLKKVVGQALLRYDELSCVVTELESIINDKTVELHSGDLGNPEVLTPNHLILGRKLRSFPKETVNWEEASKVSI
ncbi:uncharacterized protein [Macrobrachium rosenbergii]|uniref:uncharacterized protein n=1 Tax=Macrobrachium rosenbergii TaxID=79674 RepID=UPI0034D4166A